MTTISSHSASSIISEYGGANSSLKDLRRIIAKVKNVGYEQILFNGDRIFLDETEVLLFVGMLARYHNNEPISKIINSRSFWKHDFFVNSDVLDPRSETELIIEMILEQFSTSAALNFLDIGTGSGCILLSLLHEYKNAHGVGIDACPKAVEVARHNQERLSINNGNFIAVNWKDFSSEILFDVVVSNPPYIKTDDISNLGENVKNYDPLLALDGGVSGLEAYVSISSILKNILKPNGVILFEVGYDQAESVAQIMQDNGFEITAVRKDLSGIDRVVAAKFRTTQ